MINLEEVKNYLRIDYEEDDDFLTHLILVSETFLFKLTGKVAEYGELYFELMLAKEIDFKIYTITEENLARIYALALIYEMYNNKGISVEKADSKIKYTMQSILNQLRYGD